jgi:lipid-A-disaccharide synthase
MHANELNLMIVAGEPSGDAHAAALVKAFNEQRPQYAHFFGATGPLMRAAGVESVIHSDELSILGLMEIGRALPKFFDAYRKLKTVAIERNPDAVILVDWPDFNFRLARSLHARGIKVIYYISPQLWAWRSHRVRNVMRDVDLLLAILPFEPAWYHSRGVHHVEFVGHPLAGQVQARYEREEFCRRHNLDPLRPVVSFLPGSRRKELQRILPPMLDAITALKESRSDLQCVLVIAPSRNPDEAKQIISAHRDAQSLEELLTIAHHETREALAASDAAAIASGTATLEAALLSTPMVVVYKESWLNWHTLGRLITAEHYGLVNLIADERLATELMQTELTGERLATELLTLLDERKNEEFRTKLRQVAARLGNGGGSSRAAARIIEALNQWDSSAKLLLSH